MVLEARRRHAAVARLSAQLGETPQPGTLAAVLARSLGDPQLEVGYWLPAERRHVDAAGHTLELPPRGGPRAVTRIARGAEPVAVVVHDAALLDGAALEREIGAAARLAVDNERLQAAVLAQLADLRESRARIVQSADAERRRLERDLHDGAQQRLLALIYELRIARAKTRDSALAALLGQAVERADEALADLRELAHGIYPAVLVEAGLSLALATLADTAPIAVELGDVTGERHPHAVEAAAYVAVAWAIEDAAARRASFAGVSARNGDGRLVVEVGDDGMPRGAAALYVADRVAALDGRLECAEAGLRVELPCA
jgi:signal transduction histidine kinase